jgi:RND family efflux transporter MFP subunit
MTRIPWRTQVLIGGFWIGTTILNVAILPEHFAHHVKIDVVKKEPLALMVRAPGTLEPKRSETFKAEFDGTVLTKNFEDGKPVKQGQLLIEISRERIQVDYQTKSDAVKNARADLLKAEKDEKLEKALFHRQAVAYSSVEEAERTLIRARQTLQTAQDTFRLESERWNKNKITAPFDGILVKDFLENERAVASGKEILTVADLSVYLVKARVDELEIGRVEEGQDAEIRLPTYDNVHLSAKVSQIGIQPEGNGVPEIPVTLVLDSSQGLPLRPKLTADVRILTGQTEPVLSVPLSSIDNRDGETKVWLLDTSNRLRTRSVTLGRANPDRVEITTGLAEGDRVCLEVEAYFAEGMKIQNDE